jgi:betaine-aldehyde dehydrogenase
METRKMWIGGRWVPASTGETRDVINPTDGSVMARVPEASPADVREAIGAARAAFDDGPWPRLAARERGTLLFKIAEAIRSRAAAFADADTRNMGKPIVEAEFDASDAAHCFEYYGGLASKIHGETLDVPDNALSLVVREPVGVVGQIIPWNYPLLMAAWKLAPALAAGCTAVLKPAEQTPISALMLAEILEQLEFPPASSTWSPATGQRPAARWSPIHGSTRSHSPVAWIQAGW